MPQYKTTANMLEILRLLEETHAGALPINDMAHKMNVCRRTMVRWVKALKSHHVGDDGEPLVTIERRQGSAWAVLTGARPPVAATIFQYAATYAAARHLEPVAGTVLADGADEVLDRVAQGMRKDLRAMVPRVTQAFHYVPFAPKDHADSEDVLDSLVQAAVKRWRVDMDYRNMQGEASTRTVEPWSIIMYRDGFYILARQLEEEALRLFAVERISDIRLLRGEEFSVPRDFDPQAAFEHHLGLWRTDRSPERVVVAFDTAVAHSVRARQWKGFESYEEASDGRLLLIMKVTVTPEIVSWVLGWGALAEVLEPMHLRQQVAEQVHASASRYEGVQA